MNTGYFFKGLKKVLRMILVKFKPLTVHTEAIFYDDVWEIVKEKIRAKKVHTWYLMTPENFQDMKNYFWLKESKGKVEEKIKRRYSQMNKMGARLQLHVHLQPRLDMTYKEQENLIKKSIDWLKKEIGVNPIEIVFGWWRYNKDSEKICKEYGLKIIKFSDYNSMHDFDWVIDCLGEEPGGKQ